MTTLLNSHTKLWVEAKSCDYKHCDSEYILLLICHVTSFEHMFKGLCEFMGRIPSRWVTTLPCLLVNDQVQMKI